MRISNPAMSRCLRRSRSGAMAIEGQPASYKGIAQKSLLFGGVTIASALICALLFNVAVMQENAGLLLGITIGTSIGSVVMLILSFVIMFVPRLVKSLGFVYAACQGMMLGLLVYLVDLIYPGVAFAAMLGTLIVFVMTLVLNKYLGVRVSNKVMRVMIIAGVSLFAVELIVVLISALTHSLALAELSFWIQLGITAFCVVWAAIMLMFDVQTADEIVANGADKSYEWIVAFSLVTTLVYLYVEILELLIRLMAVFGRRK